jgi:uncharacterized protein (DUF433 family)
MQTATAADNTVTRTERGLTIAGTRITLYTIMDYLKADWPPTLIRHWLNLSEAQLNDSLAYIDAHLLEVEDEYQQVLRKAEAIRGYWEERNRHRFEEIAIDHARSEKTELGLS